MQSAAIHRGLVTSPSQGPHIHTYGQFRVSNELFNYIFGLWEEAGVPADTGTMQTHHREALSRDSYLVPSC
uniref:Uncharacterized protein n=1 Tax=Anguilla anguilla TaxID=7936 RepID=A0A0E9PV41_ANGAN